MDSTVSSFLDFYLYKRGNGIWYVGKRVDGKLRWKSTFTQSKAAALRLAPDFFQERTPEKVTPTIASFTKQYLEYLLSQRSKGTHRINKSIFEIFREYVGDISLCDVTPLVVDRYKSHRRQKHSPVTLNVELRALRSAFNTAVRWEYIAKNPFSRVKMASVPEMPPSYFTKDEFKSILGAIQDPWLKSIVLFAVLTGLRLGEIVNLQWNQVDFDRKVIHVQSTETFKTKHGRRRIVPLSTTAIELLLAMTGTSMADHVFTIAGKSISASWVSHRFLHYLTKAGLGGRNLHFHSLRHTFASWLVQDGVSLYEVQKLLGHSSIAVTQVYSHLQPEQLHATVNRLNVP